jgi:hypothetical protein
MNDITEIQHMSDEDEDMRPNPEYGALQELLELAEGLEEDIAEALNDAHSLMIDDEVWTGPSTATQFLEDLEYRKDDLPGLAEQLVEDIRERLRNTPEEIPVNYYYGDNVPV